MTVTRQGDNPGLIISLSENRNFKGVHLESEISHRGLRGGAVQHETPERDGPLSLDMFW